MIVVVEVSKKQFCKIHGALFFNHISNETHSGFTGKSEWTKFGFGWVTSEGNSVDFLPLEGGSRYTAAFKTRRHALQYQGNGVGAAFAALGGNEWAKTAHVLHYKTSDSRLKWYETAEMAVSRAEPTWKELGLWLEEIVPKDVEITRWGEVSYRYIWQHVAIEKGLSSGLIKSEQVEILKILAGFGLAEGLNVFVAPARSGDWNNSALPYIDEFLTRAGQALNSLRTDGFDVRRRRVEDRLRKLMKNGRVGTSAEILAVFEILLDAAERREALAKTI